MPDPTTTTAPASSGFDWSSLISTALKLYQADQSTKPGTYQQIPESPLQTAARAKLLGYSDSSPTRDILGNLIGQRLGAVRPFQLPPGANGYNPYPSGSAPSYDLSKILPMLGGGGGGTQQPVTPTPTPPGPSIGPSGGGQGGGGPFAPAGSPGDPFAGLPTGGGPNSDTSGTDPISTWLSGHPNVLRMGVDVAAGAVAAMFGIPPATAAKYVDQFMQHFQKPPDPNALPVKKPNYPLDILKPGGPAPPPRTNLNPPGLTDPWTAPFMQNGNEGGGGLRPPIGYDYFAPGKPLP